MAAAKSAFATGSSLAPTTVRCCGGVLYSRSAIKTPATRTRVDPLHEVSQETACHVKQKIGESDHSYIFVQLRLRFQGTRIRATDVTRRAFEMDSNKFGCLLRSLQPGSICGDCVQGEK